MSHDEHTHDHSHWSDMDLKVKTLESLLVEKGYVDPKALDVIVETYETRIGPRNGAAVAAAIAELGFTGRQGEHMRIVENTPETHNMVVCTLCSCYPWSVLGLPPVWYKSAPYRSRAVSEPRAVLQEFGIKLPETTKISVWDSTAEMRYLVIPLRPEGTDGWDEDKLATLVTRDAMIGTGLALSPDETSA